MVNYKIVKWCRLCKKRFVVEKGEAKQCYCEKCQIRVNKEREKEN